MQDKQGQPCHTPCSILSVRCSSRRLCLSRERDTRECFTPLVESRFRKAFEPFINQQSERRRTILKPSGDLLLGFSGGLGSNVLLDLVHKTYLSEKKLDEEKGGKEHPRKDKVWRKVRVCYVDVSDAFPEVRLAIHLCFARLTKA